MRAKIIHIRNYKRIIKGFLFPKWVEAEMMVGRLEERVDALKQTKTILYFDNMLLENKEININIKGGVYIETNETTIKNTSFVFNGVTLRNGSIVSMSGVNNTFFNCMFSGIDKTINDK